VVKFPKIDCLLDT